MLYKNFFTIISFCFLLASCASTDPEDSGDETYGGQISKQTETMSKNIGSSAVRRGMNKSGNSLFKKLGL